MTCFGPDGAVVVATTAEPVATHGDLAMSTLETSLLALKDGTALAAKLPYVAPIAALLLQALTMRDVRVTHIFLLHGLWSDGRACSSGSEAMQRRMWDSDGQSRQDREDHCQLWRVV